MFGRRTRGVLPTSKEMLMTPNSHAARQQKEDHVAKKVNRMNKSRHELSELEPGQIVRLQPIDKQGSTWKEGVVTQQVNSRTYEVKANGKTYRRNRAHIRSSKKSTHDIPSGTTQVLPQTPSGLPQTLLVNVKPPPSATSTQTVPVLSTPRKIPHDSRRCDSHTRDSSLVSASDNRGAATCIASPSTLASPTPVPAGDTGIMKVPNIEKQVITRSGRISRPPTRLDV